MKFIHYNDPDGSTLIPEGRKPWSKKFVKCCEIEADSFTEALIKYLEHMEWQPYKPIDL